MIEEINNLIANAQQDKTLYASVEDLLKFADESDKHFYLKDKTFDSITKETEETVVEWLNVVFTASRFRNIALPANSTTMEHETKDEIKTNILSKLKDYIVVKELGQLRKSHYIRYVCKYANPPVLSRGGFLTNIDANEKGVFMWLRMGEKNFIKVNTNDKLIFQKLKPNDTIILASLDYIKKFDDENLHNIYS